MQEPSKSNLTNSPDQVLYGILFQIQTPTSPSYPLLITWVTFRAAVTKLFHVLWVPSRSLKIRAPMLKMTCKASHGLTLPDLPLPADLIAYYCLPRSFQSSHIRFPPTPGPLHLLFPPFGMLSFSCRPSPSLSLGFCFSTSVKSHTLMPRIHCFSHLRLFSSWFLLTADLDTQLTICLLFSLLPSFRM